MGQRFEKQLPYNIRQKGFMKGDGVAENITILCSLIKDCQENLKPLNLVYLDVKKAFDSVSHKTVLLALHRLGVPPPLHQRIL